MGSPPPMVYMGKNWGGVPKAACIPICSLGEGGTKNWGGVSGTPPQKGDPIGEQFGVGGRSGRGENGDPPPPLSVLTTWGGNS